MALETEFSISLSVKRGDLLKIFQTVSNSIVLLTEVVGPRVLTLAPAPALAIDLDFCNIVTAKILMIDPDGDLNLWINADPFSDPITHLLKGPFFIQKDMTRIAVQNPGGLIDVKAEITFVGV